MVLLCLLLSLPGNPVLTAAASCFHSFVLEFVHRRMGTCCAQFSVPALPHAGKVFWTYRLLFSFICFRFHFYTHMEVCFALFPPCDTQLKCFGLVTCCFHSFVLDFISVHTMKRFHFYTHNEVCLCSVCSPCSATHG